MTLTLALNDPLTGEPIKLFPAFDEDGNITSVSETIVPPSTPTVPPSTPIADNNNLSQQWTYHSGNKPTSLFLNSLPSNSPIHFDPHQQRKSGPSGRHSTWALPTSLLLMESFVD